MNIALGSLDTTTVVILAVVVIALLIVGPLAAIWALNTLFPVLAIQYSFWSWLAVVLLNMHISSVIKLGRSKE